MYSPRRLTFLALSLDQGDHAWINLLIETAKMTVIKDPKQQASELVIAEAYEAYWQYRSDHIEQLTDHAASETRAMLAKSQLLLDAIRKGGKLPTKKQPQVTAAPESSAEDLLGEEPGADDFL